MIAQILKNQWLLLLSVVVNVLLVLACLWMLNQARSIYKEYRFFRPLAHGTSEATDIDSLKDSAQQVVVLFGDSRISQWQPLPALDNTIFIDAGIAGETTSEMRRRIQHDVIRHDPDVVIIQSGMNDLTASITRGIQNPDAMLSEMKTNLRYFVEVFVQSGARVIVTPVLPNRPIGMRRKIFWHDQLDQSVAQTNEYLQQLATEQSAEWLDLAAVLYDQNNALRTDWYIDALHFYQPAYEALNTAVEKHLAAPQ